MSLRGRAREVLFVCTLALSVVAPAWAEAQAAQGSTRVVGVVRDETNAIALPGVPVEVVDTKEVVYTDVDGRYVIQVPPGKHTLKIALEGYQERSITIEAAGRTLTADVGLTMAKFAETVTVVAQAVDLQTSSAEAQLIERKQSSVISDNIGSQEMKNNGDSDAAAAMSRVTGLSLVDNQYVFVRGLGERYSNTTLAGSVLPTTEPDKKVVPLDLFPTGSHRQRSGQQVVLARPLGRVRRRPCADRADEAAEPASRRLLVRAGLLLHRDRDEHPDEPSGQPRRVGLRQRRASASLEFPGRQDCSPGHLHARCWLYGEPDHGLRAGARESLGACERGRKARSELERNVRQPLRRQARGRGKRHALLQGAIPRRAPRVLPHLGRRALSRTPVPFESRLVPRRHSSASSATSHTSSLPASG